MVTIQQALQEAMRTGRWFRPVSWTGCGVALCVYNEAIMIVPGACGARPAYFPDAPDILGEWEVVEPDTVNGERQ